MAFTTIYRHSPTNPVRGREVDVNFDAVGTYVDGTFLPLSGGTMTGDLSVISLNSTFVGWGRNRIINGDMRLDQRTEGSAKTINSATAAYTLDRWAAVGQAADGVFTVTRSTSTPPTGFSHFLRATVTTADASIGSGQFYSVYQRIEGSNCYDFNLGSSSAENATLSFWVRSSLTGTFSGALQNSAQDRSYPFSYTINAANTWEQKSVTLTLDTTGTWLTTTGVGLGVYFDMGSGSTVRGTASAWAAATYYGVSSAASVIGTNAATWDLTGVQMEIGRVVSSFEYRPIVIELIMCQRYYEKSYNLGVALGSNTLVGVFTFMQTGAFGTAYGSERSFRVSKRTTPTVTMYSATGASGNVRDFVGAADVAVAAAGMGENSAGRPDKSSGNFTASNPYGWHWAADAEL